MANFAMMFRGGKATAVAVAAVLLVLAGCAKDPNAQSNTLALGLTTPNGGVAAPGTPQDFVSNVGDRIFFITDSSDLTQQAMAILDSQAQWLNRYPQFRFTIEGHADERGTREYNIALGARRATDVKNYLVSRGVAAARIDTISYGKERPVATCDAESCWAQNRRAVTVLASAGT